MKSENSTIVKASDAEISLCMEEESGAYDVCVEVGTVEGEVTLMPAEDGRPMYERWGSLENWMSSRLVALVNSMDDYERDELIARIEEAAAELIATVAS